MLLPSFKWSNLHIHKSEWVFKDLSGVQVFLIKTEYKEIKVGRIFSASSLYISILCPLLHTWNDLPKVHLLTVVLAYCPYIFKSLRTYDFQCKYIYFKK